MEETGCDGIMIGRAAQGNPWVFAGRRPGIKELKAVMRRHAQMQIEAKGDYFGVLQMRKHIAWYVSGLPGAAALRCRINQAVSFQEVIMIIDSIPETE